AQRFHLERIGFEWRRLGRADAGEQFVKFPAIVSRSRRQAYSIFLVRRTRLPVCRMIARRTARLIFTVSATVALSSGSFPSVVCPRASHGGIVFQVMRRDIFSEPESNGRDLMIIWQHEVFRIG